MKRILAVAIALAVLVLLYGTANARVEAALALVTVWKSKACNVEQQTIRWYGSFDPAAPCPGANVVNNPTTCGWDVDDSWTKTGEGRLNTGEVVTADLCVISDGTHKAPVDASVRAKHGQLAVTLDASDGRSWTASPVRSGSDYFYTACGDNFIRAPHPEVAGSNGGQGMPVTYTLTIDATNRGGNHIAAMLDYGQGVWRVSACH